MGPVKGPITYMNDTGLAFGSIPGGAKHFSKLILKMPKTFFFRKKIKVPGDLRSNFFLKDPGKKLLKKNTRLSGKMDDLQRCLQLIDKYNDKIEEGDYLTMCNLLRDVYNKRSDHVYLFDYDNFSIPPVGPDHRTLEYFYSHYYEKAVDLDLDLVHHMMAYLQRELECNRPLKRIGYKIREQVKTHFCSLRHMERSDLNDNNIDQCAFKRTCRTFLQLENAFRAKYCEAIQKKLNWLLVGRDDLETI